MKKWNREKLQAIKNRVSKETGVAFAENPANHFFRSMILIAALVTALGGAVLAEHQAKISKNLLKAPFAEGIQSARPGLEATAEGLAATELQEISSEQGEKTKTVNGFVISCPFSHDQTTYTVSDHEHSGVDLAAPKGTPVLAAASGTVAARKYDPTYGNYLILDHGDGFSTLYACLESFSFTQGEEVAAGEQIGTVGSTGMATGPHLHFEVRIHDEPVDPEEYWE